MSSHKGYKQLTREIVAPASGREVLVTVIGMISIVAIVNLMIALAPTTNTGYLALRQKWQMLQTLGERVDLLALGDSSCRQGLVPAIAVERLGLNGGLNLCTTADALAVNDAWMLESYLERFAPPRAAFVIHSFDVWQRDVSPPTVAQIPLEWGYWQRSRPRLELSTDGLVQVFAARYVPLYANDQTLAHFLRRPFRSLERYREFLERIEPDGFIREDTAYPNGVKDDARRQARFFDENPFRISPENQAALEQIRDLADAYDFPVYVAHSPIFEGLARSEAFKRYFAEIDEHLRRFAAGNENIRYLPDLITFDESVMQNADHVIESAAEQYTRDVVSRMAEDFSRRSGFVKPTDSRG